MGAYMSHTTTASTSSMSETAACGSIRMSPKQRNGAAVAATIETSSRASLVSAAIMSGHIGPTDSSTS